jgi:hypothetical protein
MPHHPIADLLMICCSVSGAALQSQQRVEAGNARLWLAPKSSDLSPPPHPHRQDPTPQQATSANQWVAEPIFSPDTTPIDWHPLIGRVASSGVDMALPLKQVPPIDPEGIEILHPHRAAFPVRFCDDTALIVLAGRMACRDS